MSIEIPDRWSFDAPTVAEGFDGHVREQLPFYDLATIAVADLARLYLTPKGKVVDLGASTGNIARALAPLLEERDAEMVNVEESAQMVSRFNGPGIIIGEPIEAVVPFPCDVVVSFLTTAFLSPPSRSRIIDDWLRVIRPGGAFIAVERVQAASGTLARRYLIQAAKLRNGASGDDVIAKEVSIGGVLRPVPASLFVDKGGWPFFAFGDFAGYVIEVPE